MKKLLSFISAIGLSSVAASSVISCGITFKENLSKKESNRIIQELEITNLGTLNDLKPLRTFNDANVMNTDNVGTYVHESYSYDDYSTADDRISTGEIAKQLFDKNHVPFNYFNMYGFTFILSKDDSIANGYKMLVRSENGNQLVCKFQSDKNIQLSINSVIDDTKEVHVPDGNIKTIAEAFEKLSIDSSVKLGVGNRQNPNGVKTINIDSHTGEGTIQLYDTTHKYSGFVDAKVVIDNYQPLNFDGFGNPYSFYNDRTKESNEVINKIDSSYKDTKLNPNKHVILMGFDGIRFDKYMSMLDPLITEKHKVYGSGYSQPSESVFGGKTDLTGSVDGNAVNIFNMVNNSKNKEEMYALGNFAGDAFETKVFAQHDKSGLENIQNSFKKDAYVNLGVKNFEDLGISKARELIKKEPEFKNIEIPSYHKTIDNTAFKHGIWKATENEKRFSKLKAVVAAEVSKDMFNKFVSQGHTPNLMLNYDTEADDEGHAFDDYGMQSFKTYHNSQLIKDTFEVYAKEMNYVLNKFGNNPDYLIMEVVDHGRNSVDSGHSPGDPDTRNGGIVSNNDHLENYISTKNVDDLNQYSIKEIIWNFLSQN